MHFFFAFYIIFAVCVVSEGDVVSVDAWCNKSSQYYCLVHGHWYGHQANLFIKEVCSVEVEALEKFVNLVPYCQVVVLSWSSHG